MEVTFIDKKKAMFGNICIGDTFTIGGDTVYMKVSGWGDINAMQLTNDSCGMGRTFFEDDEVMPCKAKLKVEMG